MYEKLIEQIADEMKTNYNLNKTEFLAAKLAMQMLAHKIEFDK